jgi:DNA-binding transcriptional MerR regulator
MTIVHLPRLGIAGAMRLYGLTARALRFYEERGLIEVGRDRFNSRFYDAAARERLDWIVPLRRVGLSLPEVEKVLECAPEVRRETAISLVETRRRKLEAELADMGEFLSRLGDMSPTVRVTRPA